MSRPELGSLGRACTKQTQGNEQQNYTLE